MSDQMEQVQHLLIEIRAEFSSWPQDNRNEYLIAKINTLLVKMEDDHEGTNMNDLNKIMPRPDPTKCQCSINWRGEVAMPTPADLVEWADGYGLTVWNAALETAALRFDPTDSLATNLAEGRNTNTAATIRALKYMV